MSDAYNTGYVTVLSSAGLESSLTEKEANMFGKMWQGAKNVAKTVDPRMIHGNKAKAKIYRGKAEAAGEGTDLARRATERADVLNSEANRGLRRLGGAAAGAAAVGYGMGDADTMENRAVRKSNQLLGTNFGTTSRFGNMIG